MLLLIVTSGASSAVREETLKLATHLNLDVVDFPKPVDLRAARLLTTTPALTHPSMSLSTHIGSKVGGASDVVEVPNRPKQAARPLVFVIEANSPSIRSAVTRHQRADPM